MGGGLLSVVNIYVGNCPIREVGNYLFNTHLRANSHSTILPRSDNWILCHPSCEPDNVCGDAPTEAPSFSVQDCSLTVPNFWTVLAFPNFQTL